MAREVFRQPLFSYRGQQVNITTWILAGGVIGWVGFLYLKFNANASALACLTVTDMIYKRFGV